MKKKYKIILATILIVTLLTPLSIFANQTDVTTIKVGYVENYGTVNEPFIKGLEGYGYEYLHELIKYTNSTYDLEFVPISVEDIFSNLENGTIDMVGLANLTDEREEKYYYTDIDFGEEVIFLATSLEDDSFYNDFENINGSKIGIAKGNSNIVQLQNFLDSNGISAAIIETTSYNHIDNIEQGLYDYYVASSIQPSTNGKIVATLGTEKLHFFMTDETLADDINYGMSRLQTESFIYTKQLYLKYFASNFNLNTNITAAEYEIMNNLDLYTVGYMEDFNPLTYVDKDGNPAGVFIDVMELIKNVTSMNVNYIAVKDDSADTSGLDISVSLQSVTENVNYSASYLSVPYMMLECKTSENNQDLNIGVYNYYQEENITLKNTLSMWNVVEYNSLDDMIVDFNNGIVSRIVMSNISFNNSKSSIDNSTYSITPLDAKLNICIQFHNGFPQEKIDIINKIINTINEEEKEIMLLTHSVSEGSDQSIIKMMQDNPLLLDSFVIFVAITMLFIVISEVKKRRILDKIINYDDSTDLISEFRFLKETKLIMEQTPNTKYAIASLDIDNFKFINEVYNFEVGTSILKNIALYINSDIEPPLFSTRRFADNFLIFDEADRLNKYIKDFDVSKNEEFSNWIQSELGDEYYFSFSIGVYEITDNEQTMDYIIDCVNYARLLGKKTIGQTINYFTDEMRIHRENNNEIVSCMSAALQKREFELYYQPKVDLQTQKITGAEALVRWFKDGELIPPDNFIPLFEKNGFIEKLDYYVVEEACRFISENNHLELPIISVNLSGITVLKEDLIENIIGIVDKHNIRPEQLDFEITESAFLSSFDQAIDKLDILREKWFKISMDDFGAGVSSLNRLKNIPLDILKIDREFIIDSLENKKGATIIKNIIKMAEELNLETVAEGIEEKEQFEFLRDSGCNVGQGYYFSRPLPRGTFLDIIYDQQDTPQNKETSDDSTTTTDEVAEVVEASDEN